MNISGVVGTMAYRPQTYGAQILSGQGKPSAAAQGPQEENTESKAVQSEEVRQGTEAQESKSINTYA